MEWHQKTVEETLKDLSTDGLRGLGSRRVKELLEEHGPNTLAGPKKSGRLTRFLAQFTEFIILILIGAAVIAGLLGEWVDSIAIISIVILNGVVGFIQEEKAEKVMEALKRLSAPTAKAVRDGAVSIVPASTLVPGDIILLESGDHVPADCRVIESNLLRVQESALTGESHPIDKTSEALSNSLPLADRINMAYLGTNAVYGRGRACVVATGMSTEMGRIARMLQEARTEPTPLQKNLEVFGRRLVYASGLICALIFSLGILRGESVLAMFLLAVSLAVAAIPEGLPAVVTIVLALGVQRMVRRHALIRKLPSVETLGSATVIASDKTGTLTQNQMTVKRLYVHDRVITVSGTGYAPSGEFYSGSEPLSPGSDEPIVKTLTIGVLCNSAELKKGPDNAWTVVGDPTEGALITLAKKAGIERAALTEKLTFVREVPFDSTRKIMTTVFKDNGGNQAFVKGALEMVLPLCSHILENGVERRMTEADVERITVYAEGFSRSALRVLALAFRHTAEPLDPSSVHSIEKDLVFAGLAGIVDPPREEIYSAVQKARSAGITPLMITGDHKETAVAIAREAGIFSEGDIAVTGVELDKMTPDALRRDLARIKVYARVNPEHKLRVVKAWKEAGETIAMTGDGVNDAPALKEADIGIAMGITGSDVTKEASDMVLTDDNFASIVAAVEEGRGIFDNIKRVVHFLLSCNIGEILVLLIASLTGMPLPLLPIQILWTNLVTDGLPALGLAMEPVKAGVMDRPPRRKDEGIVTKPLLLVMLLQGAFIAICTLGVFVFEIYYAGADLIKAQTMAFTVLVFCQKFHVFNCRAMTDSVFKLGLFSNKTLNWAVVVILTSQIAITYIPGIQRVFNVVPLSITDWAVVFAASVQPLLMMEVAKALWPKGTTKDARRQGEK